MCLYTTAWTLPPFLTLPRYCPFPLLPYSTSFYYSPQTSVILPRLEIFGTWSIDTSLPSNYISSSFFHQPTIPSPGSWFNSTGYKYSTTPHIIIFPDSNINTSHQSQHHLNAHPTASDRSILDDHHYSIILKHDHLQTSRCPALFSLIDPYLTSLTIALASFQTSPPLSLIPFRFIPSILKPAINSKINWT
jgi:hypothetical protein